jgi:hypothetical protein
MKLARYWTRDRAEARDQGGNRIEAVARGWSDEGIEDARARARDIARRVAERLATNPEERHQYQYGDRPLPEPILREFGASAVVTRNAYGALVLNVDNMMFVDVDRDGEKGVLDNVKRVAGQHDLSARVYKTAGGYRVLIGNASFEPGSAQSELLFSEFGADPLYVRLCRGQGSFRARLSPKPWRCGFRKPPVECPFETPREQSLFSQWDVEYNALADRYATCRYLETFGGIRIARMFESLIEYHDEETRANSELLLA